MSDQRLVSEDYPESFKAKWQSESPFLNEELFAVTEAGTGEKRASELSGYQLHNPFQYAFEQGQETFLEPEGEDFEERFYNGDLDENEDVDDELYDEKFWPELREETLAELLSEEEEQEDEYLIIEEREFEGEGFEPVPFEGEAEAQKITIATASPWRKKVDEIIRKHFNLTGAHLRVRFVSKQKFAELVPSAQVAELLVNIFLAGDPPFRRHGPDTSSILNHHGLMHLLDNFSSGDWMKSKLRDIRRFVNKRIRIGNFEYKVFLGPFGGPKLVVRTISPTKLIAENLAGFTTGERDRRDRLVVIQIDDEKMLANAVADWQHARNLEVDGVIGPNTWRRMKTAMAGEEQAQPKEPEEPRPTIKVARAVARNKSLGKILKWRGQLQEIADLLGLHMPNVEVLVHEACHFYAHWRFGNQVNALHSNEFFRGLRVSEILNEGVTEYFTRQLMRVYAKELGPVVVNAYSGYLAAAAIHCHDGREDDPRRLFQRRQCRH
jgi:hypothetical protein